MLLYLNKALRDIRENGFLNAITILTIGLCILILGAFAVFILNANRVMNSWESGIRMAAYLKPGVDPARIAEIESGIKLFYGVASVTFIPKDEALKRLRQQMHRQSALFEHIRHNPLPDAFEIKLIPGDTDLDRVEDLARQVEQMSEVADVEYGQRWMGRFSHIFDLFELVGYALGCLFFMASVFFVANTIRLVIYSRRDEIEIMRLVGAEDRFIKMPFYFQGLIQGLLGGLLGIAALFATFLVVTINLEANLSTDLMDIQFLPLNMFAVVIAGSMCVGWLGCFLSLKQFLRP